MAAYTIVPFLLGIAVSVYAQNQGCSVPLRDLSERPPILLRASGPYDLSSFLVPDGDHVLRMATNASFLLVCPGSNNQLLVDNRVTGSIQVNASCVSGSQLVARGATVDLRKMSCSRPAERSAVRDWNSKCGANGRGLSLRTGLRLLEDFIDLVTVCFDDASLSPIYSNYTLMHNSTDMRPMQWMDYRTGEFYGSLIPQNLYKMQKDTHPALQRINDTLIPGLLAPVNTPPFWPKDDAQLYVTTAPQWVTIKVGAWAQVELAARDLAQTRGNLIIVTGIYGILKLVDSPGRFTELFLHAEGANRKIPVPAVFWKVIYDPRTQEGVAVVVNNRPSDATMFGNQEPNLCADVCKRLHWMSPLIQGIYCCEVNALRQHVPDMPPLEVRGLLEHAPPVPDSTSSSTRRPRTGPSTPQHRVGNSAASTACSVLLMLLPALALMFS